MPLCNRQSAHPPGRLFGMRRRGRDSTDERGPCVAAQAGLQDAGQLGVTERHVWAALAQLLDHQAQLGQALVDGGSLRWRVESMQFITPLGARAATQPGNEQLIISGAISLSAPLLTSLARCPSVPVFRCFSLPARSARVRAATRTAASCGRGEARRLVGMFNSLPCARAESTAPALLCITDHAAQRAQHSSPTLPHWRHPATHSLHPPTHLLPLPAGPRLHHHPEQGVRAAAGLVHARLAVAAVPFPQLKQLQGLGSRWEGSWSSGMQVGRTSPPSPAAPGPGEQAGGWQQAGVNIVWHTCFRHSSRLIGIPVQWAQPVARTCSGVDTISSRSPSTNGCPFFSSRICMPGCQPGSSWVASVKLAAVCEACTPASCQPAALMAAQARLAHDSHTHGCSSHAVRSSAPLPHPQRCILGRQQITDALVVQLQGRRGWEGWAHCSATWKRLPPG